MVTHREAGAFCGYGQARTEEYPAAGQVRIPCYYIVNWFWIQNSSCTNPDTQMHLPMLRFWFYVWWVGFGISYLIKKNVPTYVLVSMAIVYRI